MSLLLSLPALKERHGAWQRAREARVDGVIARLIEAGLLEGSTDRALLRVQVLTQVFFWVQAALLVEPDRDPAERLELHARAALALFWPDATAAGRRQLETLTGNLGRAPARARPAAG